MHRLLRSKWLWSILVVALLAAVAVFVLFPGGEGDPPSARGDWRQEDLERVVSDWQVASEVPGVVVGVSLPDRTPTVIAIGRSDVAGDISLETDDEFRIASVTKTFVAAEILRLVAAGSVGLDDPLNVYLSETPNADTVTIRQLLSHRSGYFDAVHDDPTFVPYLAEHLDEDWTWDDVLDITFQHDLAFDPGAAYSYGNVNYMLLAGVIEVVTQRPLDEVLMSELITPLGLSHTHLATAATDFDQTEVVHGYSTHPVTGQVVDTTTIRYAAIASVSADNMISTAPDLLTWSRAMYGRDSAVLEAASRDLMLTFDSVSSYGLGAFRFETPIGEAVGHGGDTAGYLSLMEYYPAQDMSLVILVNADAQSINLTELRNSILAVLFSGVVDESVAARVAQLRSDDPAVRKEAVAALGHSDGPITEALPALIDILSSDTSAENRSEAALALGVKGEGASQVREALEDALQDPDSGVREAAQLALSFQPG